MALRDLRQEYDQGTLDESRADADPLRQFHRWFADAQGAGIMEPNAMTLASADARGVPSARIVLLKTLDERGFVFFTNYDSRKGRELAQRAQAALVFYWDKLERQVRISGPVEQATRAESEEYFRTRPRKSQLGAWVSQQSQVVTDRTVLENEMARLEAQYEGRDIPCPPHWGGYRVVPQEIEFWQGRRSRLHDRLLYRRKAAGTWTITRLAP